MEVSPFDRENLGTYYLTKSVPYSEPKVEFIRPLHKGPNQFPDLNQVATPILCPNIKLVGHSFISMCRKDPYGAPTKPS